MQTKLLADGAVKTFVLIFETGEEAMAGLREFAREKNLSGSHFTAIGALSDVTLAYFDWEHKQYRRIPVTKQVEVVSLVGDIALLNVWLLWQVFSDWLG